MSTVQEFLPGASAGNTIGEQSCPRCNSPTIRVWRRPIDRVSTWLRPACRYRCQAFLCQWEGNVRIPRDAARQGRGSAVGPEGDGSAGDAPGPLPRTFLLSMAIALATGAFILITAYTHWLEPGGFLVSAAAPFSLGSILT